MKDEERNGKKVRRGALHSSVCFPAPCRFFSAFTNRTRAPRTSIGTLGPISPFNENLMIQSEREDSSLERQQLKKMMSCNKIKIFLFEISKNSLHYL